MEKLTLDTISRHVKSKKIIKSSYYGFTQGKLCLTNLISFFNEITSLMDEGRAVDVFFLDFSKAFHTVSHTISTDKLWMHGLDGQTVK